MRVNLWLNPCQPWDDLLARARHAEQAGWDAVRVVDTAEGRECWSVVGALAAAVPRVRLDAIVRDDRGRHPAVVAKLATTADLLSHGRLLLGWIPAADRDAEARLAEACRVVKSLTTQDRTTFEGRFFHLQDAPLDPKPVQQPLPVLLSGATAELAAQYADHWTISGTQRQIETQLDALKEACHEVGRDRTEIRISAWTKDPPPEGVDELVIGDDDPSWSETPRNAHGS